MTTIAEETEPTTHHWWLKAIGSGVLGGAAVAQLLEPPVWRIPIIVGTTCLVVALWPFATPGRVQPRWRSFAPLIALGAVILGAGVVGAVVAATNRDKPNDVAAAAPPGSAAGPPADAQQATTDLASDDTNSTTAAPDTAEDRSRFDLADLEVWPLRYASASATRTFSDDWSEIYDNPLGDLVADGGDLVMKVLVVESTISDINLNAFLLRHPPAVTGDFYFTTAFSSS